LAHDTQAAAPETVLVGPPGGHHDPDLAHHFDSVEQQSEATVLGMWVFLVTEILFFGGLFLAYMVYRYLNPHAFAQGSHHLNVALGAFNTAVLIGSSLTMAMAVRAAQLEDRRTLRIMLALTILLGLTFLGVKAVEYTEKFRDHLVPGPHFHFEHSLSRAVEIFYSLYFVMTGLHALHMIIGAVMMTILFLSARQHPFTSRFKTRVDTYGLYWHFVDIVWIFLFPLLYLLGRHG
jgi:cytochrome c oxidase subunit 3